MFEVVSNALLVSNNVNVEMIKTNKISIPSYGVRQGWFPRTETDFRNGGAYPECHIAQYPMGMGLNFPILKKKEASLGFQLDDSRKTKYDSIARNDRASNKIIFSNISQLLPADIASEELHKPNVGIQEETTETTKRALEKLTNQKINAATPYMEIGKALSTQYLRFTSVQQGHEYNSGAKQRVIKMVEAQVDPMEPPKFKVSKKIPRGPPSPPAPVLHSPSRKVSMKEQKEWKVPPCISNWKNAKGYTIPLDKRLAADGRGLQQLHINEKFAKMAEALYIADRKAREAVEARAQLEKKLAQKEKDKKEDLLRIMAQRAREERAGFRVLEDGETYDMKQRNELRIERHRDRTRDKNLSRAGPDKRLKLHRERERDITELIALGKSAKAATSSETQFDQRLFNRTKGINSGFIDDEAYTVYDKPWRDSTSLGSQLHRPSELDRNTYGAENSKIIATNKFIPDKEFSGAGRSSYNIRRAPVQFEKEDDPFGLDQFLNMAKKATKRTDNEEHFFDSKKKK
ncbi:puff-specific protein Bx42 [Eupeodes corollae]|uniref:puff-specific protein Bx42 n=1 Tax=Eupeodes corollae TaxID=290404 RepID=UPI002490E0A6|nr:puff-specific protein Bx42 [Eupeodes corollae]